MAAVFLVGWTPGTAAKVISLLGFTGDFAKPWTLLTYPFATVAIGQGILFLVFELIWFYIVGSSTEKTDGVKNYLLIFFGYTLLGSFVVGVGGGLLGADARLTDIWLPLSGITCLWCARNQSAQVRFLGVIPVSGKVLAVITAASNLLIFGSGAPLLGVLALAPCVAGWLHGTSATMKSRKQVVSGRGQKAQNPEEFDKFLGQVRSKEKERQEKERLRRLLEGGSSEEE